MWVAAYYGHIGALEALIKAKADVNAAGVVSLIYFNGSNNTFYWPTSKITEEYYQPR